MSGEDLTAWADSMLRIASPEMRGRLQAFRDSVGRFEWTPDEADARLAAVAATESVGGGVSGHDSTPDDGP